MKQSEVFVSKNGLIRYMEGGLDDVWFIYYFASVSEFNSENEFLFELQKTAVERGKEFGMNYEEFCKGVMEFEEIDFDEVMKILRQWSLFTRVMMPNRLMNWLMESKPKCRFDCIDEGSDYEFFFVSEKEYGDLLLLT